MVKKRNSEMERGEKLTFRLAPRYAARVVEVANAAGISPNQFGRIATMAVAQNGFLGLSESQARIEEQLIRLRKDFNEAIEND